MSPARSTQTPLTGFAHLDDAQRASDATLLDLANVEFIDSVGLRVLLKATENVDRDGASFIVRPSRFVRRLLEITRTADRLDVVPMPEVANAVEMRCV